MFINLASLTDDRVPCRDVHARVKAPFRRLRLRLNQTFTFPFHMIPAQDG